MKRTFLILLVLVCSFSLFAFGQKDTGTINLGVMQGPTGISAVYLKDLAELQVFASPNEAIAKIVNGELDMAVLPANSVASLINKGIDISVVAITGEGMLSIVGSNIESKSIYVPGTGGTPDHMATLLYPEYEKVYSVTAPAQLAQLLIAGKCELAILPQPFVNMVTAKNKNLSILDDVQQRWAAKTGISQYPMSVLVVSNKALTEKNRAVQKAVEQYRKSVARVLESPEEAGRLCDELGILAADTATSAIPDCNLVFRTGNEALSELNTYYQVLYELAPSAIGGKVPEAIKTF